MARIVEGTQNLTELAWNVRKAWLAVNAALPLDGAGLPGEAGAAGAAAALLAARQAAFAMILGEMNTPAGVTISDADMALLESGQMPPDQPLPGPPR